jgi:hypothetical protein
MGQVLNGRIMAWPKTVGNLLDPGRKLVAGNKPKKQKEKDNPSLYSVIPENDDHQHQIKGNPCLFPGNEQHGGIPPVGVHAVELQEEITVKLK